MPITMMAPIEIHHISSQHPAHADGQRSLMGFAKEVKMIGKQRPGVDLQPMVLGKACQPGHEIFPVSIVYEDLPLFDSPPHDMMENPRSVQPRASRHARFLIHLLRNVKHILHERPPAHYKKRQLCVKGFLAH